MVRGFVRLIERLSWVCGALAGLAVLCLIGVMMVEVFARYVLGKPTLWAFDVAYMLNGAAFMLACALALKLNQHVTVDIVSQRFSPRLRRIIEVIVFTALVAPALGFICYSAWGQFWKAWVTGEIEQVSAWRPLIWPFQLVLATGLSALWLQVLARILAPASAAPTAH
jgi:TRAP-type mannitol/chloroaromatic compound transport system permease small subunit